MKLGVMKLWSRSFRLDCKHILNWVLGYVLRWYLELGEGEAVQEINWSSKMGEMRVMGATWSMVMLMWVMFLSASNHHQVAAQGYWETVVGNAGISTMHAAVTHYGDVVLLDRTNIGPSQLALGAGKCRDNAADRVSTTIHAISSLG